MNDIERNPVMPVSVGLDLSLTATGFCLKDGNTITIETIKTTPKTAPNDIERLDYITDAVMKRIPRNVTLVCIEDYYMPQSRMQFRAAMSLVMLGTVVRKAVYEAGYAMVIVAPGQIKKFCTGKGNAQKNIVVREVYRRWGVEAADDNQADACTLAYMAEALVCPSMELTKYQQETIDKVSVERPSYNMEAKDVPSQDGDG